MGRSGVGKRVGEGTGESGANVVGQPKRNFGKWKDENRRIKTE